MPYQYRKLNIFHLGEEGSGIEPRGTIQNFSELKSICLKEKVLFKDPLFPCKESSIFFSNQHQTADITWMRPHEMCHKPQLFVDGFSRFDIKQGKLGDCWLLAAIASLTLYESLFYQVVPMDQSFNKDYAGIFHFRFWQYGRWVDVVIDDRLPMMNGKLLFLHSSEKNEFWGALLEKAYAKLHHCYEALSGGWVSEAMEDFTGGIAEMHIFFPQPPDNLYENMLQAFERNSLISSLMLNLTNEQEARTNEGLVRGHAYSITGVKFVDVHMPYVSSKMPLVRVRNPWGNQVEWNGAWSDKSPEWNYVSDRGDLQFENDGEFWMYYHDFTKHMTGIEFCHLSPNTLLAEDSPTDKQWEMKIFEGQWVPGISAGGITVDENNEMRTQSFSLNPQYRITLKSNIPDEEITVIIALMQKNRRAQRKEAAHGYLSIGYYVYKLENPENFPKHLGPDFFGSNNAVATSYFRYLREVTCRFSLLGGTYCIIPATRLPDEAGGEFLLRVFTEKSMEEEEKSE